MKIDMRYLYGRNFGQVLNIYDFAPDTYYTKGTATLNTTSGADTLLKFQWMGDFIGTGVHVYQEIGGLKKMLGQASNFYRNGNDVIFEIQGDKAVFDPNIDVIFAVKGRYNINTTVTISGGSVGVSLGVGDETDAGAGAVQSPGQAEVELNIQDGLIVGANVVNGGFGFTSLPDITINSDTGALAKLTPVLKFTRIDDASQLAQISQDAVVTVISCIEK